MDKDGYRWIRMYKDDIGLRLITSANERSCRFLKRGRRTSARKTKREKLTTR